MVPVAAVPAADVYQAGAFTLATSVAAGCLIWYIVVVLVCSIGYVQLCVMAGRLIVGLI